MRLPLITLFRFLVVNLLLTGPFVLFGQSSLVSEQIVATDVRARIALDWRIDAADRALRSGLVGLAEASYRAILVSPSLDVVDSDQIRIRLAATLIALRRYEIAVGELNAVRDVGRNSQYYLYSAIATYGEGKAVERTVFAEALGQVRAVELNSLDLPWWHLARGLRAELADQLDEVIPAFEKAASVTTSDGQKAFFESLVFRQKMLQTPSDEALAAEIRSKLEQFSDDAAAYTFAREYAVILNNMGRSEEAISVIDQQLSNNKAFKNREREQLFLLKGMIAGQSNLRGRGALQELVRSGQTREVMRVALHLLGEDEDAATNGLSEFLNQMGARAEPHLMLAEIYYLGSQLSLARAENALTDGDFEAAGIQTLAAEKNAKFVLEQFPGFQQITSVYRLLAYAALQRKLPQYRAAADFLIQLRDQTEAVLERTLLNRLIGDCYFLNKDYVNAVDFYRAAYARSIDGENDSGLFLRLITAEVRAGQIESALQHIDEADFNGKVSDSDRWRAEWNIAQALKASGQVDVALERVRLLVGGSLSGIPAIPSLDIRLLWLEAYLSFLQGDDETLSTRVSALLARVESLPKGALEEDEAKLLVTEIMLLQAQELIRSGQADGGVEVLRRLRVGFAESLAAQRSYLIEADYHASINDFKAAQETLSKMASLYAESILAPQAIFEAAVYCERRGPEFFEQAVLLLDQITEIYPSDALVYSARLKQGDLLRKMNDFAGAQIIYENLINSEPAHSLRYIPELSRVDCMLALAKDNDAQLGDVILSLDRLIDVPNLPVDFQAEVGYKWGFALAKRGSPMQAKEVFMLIASRFLLDGEQAPQVGATGRYWLSRSLLALGSILEEAGDISEARRVYRKMVAFNLPGRNLALERANSIQVREEAAPQ